VMETTKRLVEQLCQRSEHNAARGVVDAVEHLFHADDLGWLRRIVDESEDGPLDRERRAALQLLGVPPDTQLPAGLTLSTVDVLSARRVGWRIVVEPGHEPAVRATSSPEDDPIGQGTWAVYRNGVWTLCRVDDVGDERLVRHFTTLRAAIAYATTSSWG